jgi:prepilin-type N-terminal cleavage/methylation domain-containing protein
MTMTRRVPRRGVTLIELLVVIAILGIVAGIGGLAPRRRSRPTALDVVDTAVANARARAVRTGSPQSVAIRDSAGLHALTAFPDGSVAADRTLRVIRATGRTPR